MHSCFRKMIEQRNICLSVTFMLVFFFLFVFKPKINQTVQLLSASVTIAYFVTTRCRLGKFLPHSCGALTTSTTFGSNFRIHYHIASQRFNIWVLSSLCQLQFFEHQANSHNLLPEKGCPGERPSPKKTRWMEKKSK